MPKQLRSISNFTIVVTSSKRCLLYGTSHKSPDFAGIRIAKKMAWHRPQEFDSYLRLVGYEKHYIKYLLIR